MAGAGQRGADGLEPASGVRDDLDVVPAGPVFLGNSRSAAFRSRQVARNPSIRTGSPRGSRARPKPGVLSASRTTGRSQVPYRETAGREISNDSAATTRASL